MPRPIILTLLTLACALALVAVLVISVGLVVG
jgi:hypothetical protein